MIFMGLRSMRALVVRQGYWTDFTLSDDVDEYPNVKGRISFTRDHLHIKATVKDTHFRDGNRSWRYGDGFLINFITEAYPDARPSPRFYAYGFSVIAGEERSALVCHDGTYYLRNVEPAPEIEVDEAKRLAVYDVKVPWANLMPFHPLIDELLGINIRYTSQRDDGSTTRLHLVADDEFESELVVEKNYLPVNLRLSDRSRFQFAFGMESNLVESSQAPVWLKVYSERSRDTSFSMRVRDDGEIVDEKVKEIHLEKGVNVIEDHISTPDRTALYQVELTLDDVGHDHEFLRLSSRELPGIEEYVREYARTAKTPIEVSSLHGLTFKTNELKASMSSFKPRDRVASLKEKLDELNALIKRCRDEGYIYGDGYIRTAFRSPDDGALQPYSIECPPNFDPGREYRLLLALHGSGVDEVGFIKGISRVCEALWDGYLLVAPRGRGLSDWYAGQTERDVLEILSIVETIFKVSETVIFGFSMGGYGVWRLTFLHPDRFDAAIIGSGSPLGPRREEPSMDVRSLRHGAKRIPYLVMHGTEDRAVAFEPVREFVDLLDEEGFDVTFKVFDGSGHGNYDPSSTLAEWMSVKIG